MTLQLVTQDEVVFKPGDRVRVADVEEEEGLVHVAGGTVPEAAHATGKDVARLLLLHEFIDQVVHID